MKFFLPFIITLLIFVLYVVFFPFRFYIHPLFTMITHGVSGGKIYFFLIYSFILFFILHLFRNKKNPTGISSKYLWCRRLFFISVFLGMASSMGSYLHYIYRYDLSIENYHYHFKEVYNSVNFLPHIHTSKLYLYIAGKALGISHLLKNMDDGRVFFEAIPVYYAYLTLLSIILSIPLSFYLVRDIVYKWDERFRTGIAILCCIAFSSVIKTISDGGPLSYDFLMGINIIFVLTMSKCPEDVIAFFKNRWRIFFWGLFVVFSFMCLVDNSFEILKYTVKNSFNIVMVYAFIYFFTVKDKIGRRWFLSISFCFLLFFSYTLYLRYMVYIRPFHIELDRGTKIHYFYYKDRALPDFLKNIKPIFNEGFIDIYSIDIEKKVKAIDIYRAFNENPYRGRHIAIITPKKRQAYGIIGDILFIDLKDKNASLKVPQILHLKMSKKDAVKDVLQAEIAFDPSYFPALSHVEEVRITQIDENHKFVMYYFLNRFFFYYGVREYILTPVAFYRFN